ncbi:hypothetical protein C491_03590 [Natronococcus amylolyticus DSM 10524]|uniref:SipW-cognate class signal peptide n=1 Tax=Natronococcus amylolyticus DSM 10524 TaxID=1227497 RepID=L9XG00_9EURY|nr:SipW-dependent-type signal peptide-containing protein [Natronococcus amylolyticus]ELY60346.1 hypothetical protein C491_03590 [Natronococcus amylolyticus DSM 10524]
MTKDGFEISRRKALAGLGMVGVASAGAGLGTTAYFSDQEEFDENTITAGEFGLTVDPTKGDVDQDGLGPDEGEKGEAAEGVFKDGIIKIEDAKPGDEYEFCWEVTVHDNPGYVALRVDKDYDKNGVEASNLKSDNLPWDIDSEDDLSTIGKSAEISAYVNDTSVSLHDLLNGKILPGANGDCHDPDETVEFCVEIEIPTDVGNEIQGAEVRWDTRFYAEQCRHNDPETVVGRLSEME